MASSGSRRSGLLTAGGVLSIVAGAIQIIVGLIVVGLMLGFTIWSGYNPFPHMPWMPGSWSVITEYPLFPTWLTIIGVPAVALGIVAIVGGVSALRRKSFGLSLAGAICGLPSTVFGILAIIFISVSKKEFETGREQSGIQW